jgi:hypothetical protein
MFLFLCLLFGQRPLAVEAAGAGQNGITPHLRVTLETQSHPPVIEYEVWIEGPGGRPPGIALWNCGYPAPTGLR